MSPHLPTQQSSPAPHNPNTSQHPLSTFFKITPQTIILLLLLLSFALIFHNYIKTLYQKELKTHASLSLELNKWLQEEQALLTRLQKIKTYQEDHPLANLEEQPNFKQQWKKVKLLHIPIVTIEESGAETETLEISEHLTFTSQESSKP